MIPMITVVEPEEWFNPEPKRTLISWREGITVGDLLPNRDATATVFKRNGKIVTSKDCVEAGDTIVVITSPGVPGADVAAFLIYTLISSAITYGISLLFAPPDIPEEINNEKKPSQSFTFGGTRTIYSGSGVPLPLVYGQRAVGGVVVGRSVFASGSPQPQQILNLTLALCTGEVTSIGGISTDKNEVMGNDLPGDILINENPISSYEGIELSVRTGTANQEPIRGSSVAAVESTIGLPIDQLNVADALPAVTDWSKAVTYIMPEEGDGVLLTIGFPEGLYSGGGASAGFATADFEVRYRKVDGAGVPFGVYWPGGSVDPTAGIPISIKRAVTASFGEGVYLDLIDPNSSVPGASSESKAFKSTVSQTLDVDDNLVPATWQGIYADSDGDSTFQYAGLDVENYSVECWVQLAGNGGTTATPSANGNAECGILFINDEFQNLSSFQSRMDDPDSAGAASFKGLCIYATLVGSTERYIGFYWGDGIGVGEGEGWERCGSVSPSAPITVQAGFNTTGQGASAGIPDPITGERAHILCTYEKDFNGTGTNRARLFVNGALQATKISLVNFAWPESGDLWEAPPGTPRGPVMLNRPNGAQLEGPVGPATAPYDRTFTGTVVIDRVVFYGIALTEDQAFFKYSGGLGSIPKILGESVEAWWEMDDIDVQVDTTMEIADRSGNEHSLSVYKQTMSFSSTSGLIQTATVFDTLFASEAPIPTLPASVGTPDRSRYEINIQRTNLVIDNDQNSDRAKLETVTIFNSTSFSFPGVALLSVRLPAQDQLSNLSPNFSIPVRGPAIPIWDGVSEVNPTYDYRYTQNNAWISLDMATSVNTGMNKFHDLTRTPLLPKIQAWADFCDELVSDQVPTVYLSGQPVATEFGALTYSTNIPLSSLPGPALTINLGLTASGGLVPIPPAWKAPTDSGFPPSKWIEISGVPLADQANGWPEDGTRLEIVGYGDVGSIREIHALWPEGMDPPTSPLVTAGFSTISVDLSLITLDGLEARSECDVVLDEENASAWDAILKVASGGRAIPVRVGDRLGASFQGVRSPVQMFSSANIIPGSLTLSSITSDEEFNTINYKFYNRNKQWRREAVTTDHATLSDGSETLRTTKNFSSSTITRPSQIARESRYQLNFNYLVRQWIEFETFTEALALEPGDVFLFSGSLPAYGFAGRLPAAINPGSTDIIVDVDVEIGPDDIYNFAAITQTGAVQVQQLTAPAGFYAAGDTITAGTNFEYLPADTHWAIGTLEDATRKFQVSSITISTDLTVKIVGAEYLDEVYDETGFPDLPESSGTELYDPTQGNGFPPPLAALSVEEFVGPNPFGSSGAFGILVSIQHAVTSPLLGTTNLAGNANSVRVMGKLVGSTDAPVILGTIQAGSTMATFDLGGGIWRPGDTIEVSASAESPTGAALGPQRSRKARIQLTGRGPMPSAPSGLTAIQTGSSVIYRIGVPESAERARPVSAEIRAGGWILGQHVATLGPGESTRPTDAWFSLPSSSGGRSSIPLVARYEYANGQWSDAVTLTDFAPTAPGPVIAEDSFEDGPWDAVTGDSGAVALVELESETQGTGEEWLRFEDASTELVGTWTSPEYDTGREREWAVFFAIEGGQIMPTAIGGSPYTSKSRGIRDESNEGPLSNFPDLPEQLQGQVQVTLEVAYSDTATPGTDWQEYRPGVYSARSFAFRITFTRPNTSFNVDVWRGAFRITEPAQVVTYAGSF